MKELAILQEISWQDSKSKGLVRKGEVLSLKNKKSRRSSTRITNYNEITVLSEYTSFPFVLVYFSLLGLYYTSMTWLNRSGTWIMFQIQLLGQMGLKNCEDPFRLSLPHFNLALLHLHNGILYNTQQIQIYYILLYALVYCFPYVEK